MYNCDICNINFENFQSKANHVRWNHKDELYHSIFREKVSVNRLKEETQKKGKLLKVKVICDSPYCDNQFFITIREKNVAKKKHFCNRVCANTRKFDKISKAKQSIAAKNAWKDDTYALRVLNKNAKNNRRYTSKGEREVREFFIKNFPLDKWTFGGGIRIDGKLLSRDLYSVKLKVCIEYDGIWHFQDIKGQLKHKQYKDSLLEKWCSLNNYRLIRIKEEVYFSRRDFWLKKLKQEAYEGTLSLVKFY